MKLLIVTVHATEGKLIGALLRTTTTCVVKATKVFDAFEAPLSVDADLLATLKEFRPDAYLFLYTGCPKLTNADIQSHRSGWRERVGAKPTIFVIEDVQLWTPGNNFGASWCGYLVSNPDDNDEGTIGEELAKLVRRCATQVQATK